jgi:glucose-1-phosphate thymidylyltransferase
MDAGTVESFLEASLFVSAIEKEKNIKISCPEEIAFNSKWINEDKVKIIAKDLSSSSYSDYLLKIIKN